MDEVNRELWANPSSVHRFGQMVRQRLELARATTAKLVGALPRELIFTSGGTESDNLALQGLIGAAGGGAVTLITNRVEHSAVREPAEALGKAGHAVRYLDVDAFGRVDVDQLSAWLAEADDAGLAIVSVQWANNETGVVQPMSGMAEACAAHRGRGGRVVFHSDATQAVGKLAVDVKAAGLDLATFAAHKFHGPKGAGALYVRSGMRIRPQQLGGPQERERRGGTENVAAMVGMGVAAEEAATFVDDAAAVNACRQQRDRFESAIEQACPNAVVHSRSEEVERLWNTSNIGFPRLEAEAILLGLSERGVCASAGAACSSGSLDPSPVLLAMGVDEPVAHGSIRFSLSRQTTDEQINRAIAIVPEVVARLSRTLPMGV